MENRTIAVYLGIGTNIDPINNLIRAIRLLQERSKVKRISSVWETRSIGSEGPNFLNAVVLIHTELSPPDLKTTLISPIEVDLGRVRTADKFAPRTIDIDILIHDNNLLDEDAFDQAHYAVPLAELFPDYRHPDHNHRLLDVSEKMLISSSITMRTDLVLA